METHSTPASYQAFLEQYVPLSATELVQVFNSAHAANPGWTTARANSSAALRHCFLQTGYDVSGFIAAQHMLCDAPLIITGRIIQRNNRV